MPDDWAPDEADRIGWEPDESDRVAEPQTLAGAMSAAGVLAQQPKRFAGIPGVAPVFSRDPAELPGGETPEEARAREIKSKEEMAELLGFGASIAAGFTPVGGPKAAWGLASSLRNLASTGLKSGALSGVVGEGVKQVAGSGTKYEPEDFGDAASRLAWSGVKSGALGTGLNLVLGRTIPAAFAGAAALKTDPSNAGKIAWRTLTSPASTSGQALEQLGGRALAARLAEENKTGIWNPIGIQEIVRSQSTRSPTELAGGGHEFASDAVEELNRQILSRSSMVPRNDPSQASQMASKAVDVFEDKLKKLSGPARAAAYTVQRELGPAATAAEQRAQAEAAKLLPTTGITATQMGTDAVRKPIQEAEELLRSAYDETFSIVRGIPAANARIGDFGSLNKGIQKLIDEMPVESQGTKAVGVLPTGVRAIKATVDGLDPTQSLVGMQSLLKDLSSPVRSTAIFPGADDGALIFLSGELRKDIERLSNKLPPGVAKLARRANQQVATHVDLFRNTFVRPIVQEAGETGALGPSAISEQLIGKEAPTIIAKLEAAVGKGGQAQLNTRIGDYLNNVVRTAGTDSSSALGGTSISVGDVIRKINTFEPEVIKRYFPNLGKITALAKIQAASLAPGTRQKILDTLQVDNPDELMAALGPNAGRDMLQKIGVAFKENAALNNKIRGEVVGALRAGDGAGLATAVARNKLDFVDSIFTKFDKPQVERAMGMLKSTDPKLWQQVQSHYLDTVVIPPLAKGQELNIGEVIRKLNTPEVNGTARAVLADGFDPFIESLKHLETINLSREVLKGNPEMGALAAQAGGMAAGAVMGPASRMGPSSGGSKAGLVERGWGHVKYWMAKYMYQDQEARKIALTPVNHLSIAEQNKFIRSFYNYLVDGMGIYDQPQEFQEE